MNHYVRLVHRSTVTGNYLLDANSSGVQQSVSHTACRTSEGKAAVNWTTEVTIQSASVARLLESTSTVQLLNGHTIVWLISLRRILPVDDRRPKCNSPKHVEYDEGCYLQLPHRCIVVLKDGSARCIGGSHGLMVWRLDGFGPSIHRRNTSRKSLPNERKRELISGSSSTSNSYVCILESLLDHCHLESNGCIYHRSIEGYVGLLACGQSSHADDIRS